MNNVVTIVGNLTREPELRYTPSGAALAKFGVAVNKKWTDKSGKENEEVSFFDVDCWKSLAENVAESLSQGDRVIVTGRLKYRSWETEDGSKRSKIDIEADEVGPALRFASASVTKNPKKGYDE